MSGPRRLRVRELHPNLLCILCGGYYVDATTIVECLHSFCKTCIVRYLESSKFCPICDVQVHKTKPLLSIRPDKTLQDIVYKLVPGLYPNEMCKRREFYSSHPDTSPATPEDGGNDLGRSYTLPDDPVSLAIYPASPSSTTSLTSPTHHTSYNNHVHLPSIPSKMTRSFHQRSSESRVRYLQCPAGVSVAQLKRLIRAKFGVGPGHPMALLTIASEDPLHDSLTLVDVAYITTWQRNEPMQLLYRIYEKASKKIKLDPEVCVVDTHISCEEMPKLEPSVGSGAMISTISQDTAADYSTAPLLQAVGAVDSPTEERPFKSVVNKALKLHVRPSERPTTAQQDPSLGKVPQTTGMPMDVALKDSQVIQNCDTLLEMTQAMVAGGAAQAGAVEPIVTYPGVFAAPSNGVSVGVALVSSELGLLAPTNVTCAIIPGATATLPVLCGTGGEWAVTRPQAGGQVVAPAPPPVPAPAGAVTIAAAGGAGERGPQVPGEPGDSCKNGVSGGEAEEGEEVQLKISESGVMSVCGKDTTVEGVLNSLESEAGELLSKIESGSLGEEFPSVSYPKNSEKKKSKSKGGSGQGRVAIKAEDKGNKCQPLHKDDRTPTLSKKVVEVDSKKQSGSSSKRDSFEAATITTTVTSNTTSTTNVPLDVTKEEDSINGEREEVTASTDGVLPDALVPGDHLNCSKEIKEEGAKSSRASHIPASLAAASLANLNKPLLKVSSSKVQQSEDKYKEQKLSNNALNTKEMRSESRGAAVVSTTSSCRKASHSYGYKTLKTPPKSWNPTISREHLAAGKSMAGKSLKDPPRPNKFFKARNRSASVEAQSGSGPQQPCVLKIDPKTLGPISASIRSETGFVPTSLPSQGPALPPTSQVTTSQVQAVTLTSPQDRCGEKQKVAPLILSDTGEVPPAVRKDVAHIPQSAPSEGKESTNHSAKVVGTTKLTDNNSPTKSNSNNIINNSNTSNRSSSNNNNNNDNFNNNNNNNNNNDNYNSDDKNSNTNDSKSNKSGKSLANNSVNVSKTMKIQSVQTQMSEGKAELGGSSTRADKTGIKTTGSGGVGIPMLNSTISYCNQLKLAPCSTSSQVSVGTVSTMALPQLQPQALSHLHTQHQTQPVPLPQHQGQSQHQNFPQLQHQSQIHPLPSHQSQPQLQTQLQLHPQPQLTLQAQHQSQPQPQLQQQSQPQPQIQPQPQQQLAIGSPTIGIIPSSGVSFTGAIGALPLPYYTSPPLAYPAYPYFYQTPEAIGLMPPHSFFSPCLPPRSPLSSRTIGGPKMMSELPLQLSMLPVVSQGPNQTHSQRPMTPPSPRTSTPTQPSRPYPAHSPRQSCTNISRPHTPQSPKPFASMHSSKASGPQQSSKPLVSVHSPNPHTSVQSSKSLASSQPNKPLAPLHPPKSLAPAQSPKLYTPAQSSKTPTSSQSPKPLVPPQSPKSPAPVQSPKPHTLSQSPKHLASAQSPRPLAPAQSPKPHAVPLSPKSPGLAQSPKSPALVQSPKLPTPAQSPKPSGLVQLPMTSTFPQSLTPSASPQSSLPPAPPQSPKPPASPQSPKLVTTAQSPMLVTTAQSPMPSASSQSIMPPIPPQSSRPLTIAQSLLHPFRSQMHTQNQLSATQSLAIQPQPHKVNHSTSAKLLTTCTMQPSHSDKIAPMPKQLGISLTPAPQSSVVLSSGSSFCPQNTASKSSVFLQTPTSQSSATTKVVSSSLDISKSILPQPTISTISNQSSSCSALPITVSAPQSMVLVPSQTPKSTNPQTTYSLTSMNSVHSINSQVKFSHLDAKQMMYQGAPSSSRHDFKKNNNTEKIQEPRLADTIQVPTTIHAVTSTGFPAISVANKGLSWAPATTFGSGYYPHGLHLSLSSNCSPTYTDSIKTNPHTNLTSALMVSTTHTTSSLPFPTPPLVSMPVSSTNIATVTAIPSLTTCPVLSAPSISSSTAPSTTLTYSVVSSASSPKSSVSPQPSSAHSNNNKETIHFANATEGLLSVVSSSCSSVDTVSTTTTVAVTVNLNATRNSFTNVNTLATSLSITNTEALISCCTALATLPVINSVPTLAVSSLMSSCTVPSSTAPLSSVLSVAIPEQSTAGALQRNVCHATSVNSMTDEAASIVGVRTSPMTKCSGENTPRCSSVSTASQDRGGGSRDTGGGAAAADPDGSHTKPPVQPLAPATSESTISNSSSNVAATSLMCSGAGMVSSCDTAGVPLPARKETLPMSQSSGCSSPHGSVGELSVPNVMEKGGCELQSSACTPVCDVTHVIDAKQQCAEPNVSSSDGPRPCLKS